MVGIGAMVICENILSLLKKSGLNFVIQETPFSAYVTIRKTFCKDFENSEVTKDIDNEENKVQLVKLETENNDLRNELEEGVTKYENLKNENQVLQERLENAEKEILKHFTESKLTEARLAQEASNLKQTNNICNDKISGFTSDISKKEKKIKSLETMITKSEHKNRNVTE